MACPRALLGLALSAPLGLITACGDNGAVHTIDATREVESGRALARVSSDERFGYQGMPAARGATSEAAPQVSWTVPAGWTELPARPPRAGSFSVPGGVDCSLTSLPGAAGGVGPNVNRWRDQMGLPPWTEQDIASLPTQTMLGGSAVRVEFVGAYSGMGNGSTTDGAKLVGYILAQDSRTVFVKLVGPVAAVDGQLGAVEDFVASLDAGHDHAAHASTDDVHATDSDLPPDPHSDPHASVMVTAPDGNDPLGLQWVAPDHWKRGAERPLRIVSYSPADQPEVECYVVVLGGTGGGMAQNINLWRQQLGIARLGPDEPLSGSKLEVLGQASPLVELTGTEAAAGRGMLGLVCPLPTHTVFIKMVGPADAVQAQKNDFIAFCRSLEF